MRTAAQAVAHTQIGGGGVLYECSQPLFFLWLFLEIVIEMWTTDYQNKGSDFVVGLGGGVCLAVCHTQ